LAGVPALVPANAQTADQLLVRNRLATLASTWDSLAEVQQDAWIAARWAAWRAPARTFALCSFG
jgi:hypothetical protein